MRLAVFALAFLGAAACSADHAPEPAFHAEENPEYLSEWGMLTAQQNSLRLSDGVIPYDLATPLFSDYALKLRTIWMPEGAAAEYRADSVFDFPVGAVITKTFYYPQESAAWNGAVKANGKAELTDRAVSLAGYRLMETRILVRREHGWDALPYVWNEDQTDAVLKRVGDVIPLTLVRKDGRREAFSYLVPNQNQCAGCHAVNATTKAIQPIGPKARHLNKQSTFSPAFNQLDYWIASGLLAGDFEKAVDAPRNALWDDETAGLNARARNYLDANCSHCHNPNGPADTSGLNLEPDAAGPALGHCKQPIAAGGGSGGRPYDITPGEPEESIAVFRMETTDPGAMMPELGRAVVHEEGVALIAAWIAEMPGGCG